MEKKMEVFEGSSINADTIKIVITEGEKKLFEKKYYYGYDINWNKAFSDKPFDKDLIASLALTYGIDQKDIKYSKGENIFRDSKVP
jgi:hypothetical protein